MTHTCRVMLNRTEMALGTLRKTENHQVKWIIFQTLFSPITRVCFVNVHDTTDSGGGERFHTALSLAPRKENTFICTAMELLKQNMRLAKLGQVHLQLLQAGCTP